MEDLQLWEPNLNLKVITEAIIENMSVAEYINFTLSIGTPQLLTMIVLKF